MLFSRCSWPGCRCCRSKKMSWSCHRVVAIALFSQLFRYHNLTSQPKPACTQYISCSISFSSASPLPATQLQRRQQQIVMPHTAVKATGTKNIVVRNLGTRAASVSLSCEPAGTFSITPAHVVVSVGTSSQLELGFNPERSVRWVLVANVTENVLGSG